VKQAVVRAVSLHDEGVGWVFGSGRDFQDHAVFKAVLRDV
jgi:hypothetical protein